MDRPSHLQTRPGAVGAPTPRPRAKRLVAGRGKYADDLAFPRLLHAAFVRSPHAHARIVSIDVRGALEAPGVVHAYDGAAIGTVCQPWQTRLATWPAHRSPPQPALAPDRVLWQGQPVAIVLAESRAQAEDGAARVAVDWDPLDAVADAAAALAPDAPLIHPMLGSNLALEHRIDVGEAERVFAAAHATVAVELRFARHTGVPLEPRTLIAEFDPTLRQLTVHQSTQVPHQMRTAFAEALGLAEHDVRVVTPDVGGGFGIKLHVYDDEMATAAAAVLCGRPVKYQCDRLEAFVSDVHARAHRVRAEAALAADGTVLAFRFDDLAEAGGVSVYPRSSILEGLQAVNFFGIAYGVNAYQARLRVAYLNKVPTGSYRGVGQPVACGAVEALMDQAARRLAIDPAEIRRRNYRTAQHGGARTPTGIDAGGLSHATCLDRLLELIDYPGLRARQAEARAHGRHLGIGLAAFVEQNSPGPAFYGAAEVKIAAQDGCTLRLEPSGTLTCITSNADQGQGVETALAQLVAGVFGIGVDAVRVVGGDTFMTAVGGGTFASRGLTLSGEAALGAAAKLRERLIDTAAALWNAAREDIVLADGLFRSRTDDARRMTLAALADVLNYRQQLLPPGFDASSMVSAQFTLAKPFLLANGVQASLVEVDAETGFVKLLGHWCVEDCGRVINPLLADEQLRGGIVQGLGPALFEECRYDETGQMLTGSMADYLVPMFGEMPDIVIGHVETPVADTALGAKGIGEAGTIGAGAAVGNAINDALAPFGAFVAEQPYTPERILRALGKVA
jgi:carbon-monoxide dehydrogenase large subunit